jgi:hypothetical protein
LPFDFAQVESTSAKSLSTFPTTNCAAGAMCIPESRANHVFLPRRESLSLPLGTGRHFRIPKIGLRGKDHHRRPLIADFFSKLLTSAASWSRHVASNGSEGRIRSASSDQMRQRPVEWPTRMGPGAARWISGLGDYLQHCSPSNQIIRPVPAIVTVLEVNGSAGVAAACLLSCRTARSDLSVQDFAPEGASALPTGTPQQLALPPKKAKRLAHLQAFPFARGVGG